MTIFHLPDLGEGLEEAEIREWYVSVGDKVRIDQPLVSVETAKALVDVPSPQTGVIAKLYGQPGEFIKTHAPLIDFNDETTQGESRGGSVVGHLEESENLYEENIGTTQPETMTLANVKAMPHVRRLAAALQVDLTHVKASGPQGQVTEEDVKHYDSAANRMHGEKLQGVRYFMAKAMTKAHQESVPVTIVDDADVTDLTSDITIALIKAITRGVKAEPALNAWYDSETKMRQLQASIHLGLAVDTPDGLFVPVIKNVQTKNAEALRAEINAVKQSVKDRTISQANLQGATISLSNFGMFAGRYATVMIMPPMVAILGCGKMEDRVCVKNGAMVIRRLAPLSLTFDHRVVTGGEAARFLAHVISSLEGDSSI